MKSNLPVDDWHSRLKFLQQKLLEMAGDDFKDKSNAIIDLHRRTAILLAENGDWRRDFEKTEASYIIKDAQLWVLKEKLRIGREADSLLGMGKKEKEHLEKLKNLENLIIALRRQYIERYGQIP